MREIALLDAFGADKEFVDGPGNLTPEAGAEEERHDLHDQEQVCIHLGQYVEIFFVVLFPVEIALL